MSGAWKIAIVDDSPDDRAEIRRLLLLGSERRYAFLEVEMGEAGVRACRDSVRPDCMLLDYNLPDMDALDALAVLLGDDGNTICPVVVLTGEADYGGSHAALRAGAQDYLGKAWMTPETITRAVENAVERWRMSRELREADRRKDQFLATLAHELRNPLMPISASVQVLRRVCADARGAAALDIIERQVSSMTRFIDELLDASRIGRGRMELMIEPVDLRGAAQAAVETSRPLIDRMHHALEVKIPGEPVMVVADSLRLTQVFSNLLNNAAKYTPSGSGRIELRLEREAGAAVVSVKDNGAGIRPQELPNLFRMFYQTEQAQARSSGGLGIGLALVKGLVTLHGGTVEARSAGSGQGSEFVVRLPVAANPPARPAS